MKTCIRIAFAAMLLGAAAPDEIKVRIEGLDLTTDEVVCILANGVVVDFVKGLAGQKAVRWDGLDISRRVDFSKYDSEKLSGARLSTLEAPEEETEESTREPRYCTRLLPITFTVAPTKRENVVEFAMNAADDSGKGPFILRLSIDCVKVWQKTVDKLPHTLKWSIRGLRPGSRVITLEVFDADGAVGTSSLALEVKEKE